MEQCRWFLVLSTAMAYHLPDDISSLVPKSKELTKKWLQLPVVRGSEEYQWLGQLSDAPSSVNSSDSEGYHWIEDDVVERERPRLDLIKDNLLELPGGCELTEDQYQRLQEFRRDTHYVQKCYCQEGGIYCKLKKGGEHLLIT